MTYRITLRASKIGSIGSKYCERRVYDVEAPDRETAQDTARILAYAEDRLEHTLIIKVEVL